MQKVALAQTRAGDKEHGDKFPVASTVSHSVSPLAAKGIGILIQLSGARRVSGDKVQLTHAQVSIYK